MKNQNKNIGYSKLSNDFFKRERKTITNDESLVNLEPFDFSENVLNGKTKISVYEKEK